MLIEHEKPVNCVRWIRTASDTADDILVSSSNDKAVVWNRRNNLYIPFSYAVPNVKCTYTVIDAIHYQNANNRRKLIVATATSEHRVIIFENENNIINENNTSVKQIMNFKNGFALDVKFCVLSAKFPLLAIAGSESIIRLYTQQNDDQFICVCVLSGHDDWVRGLDFFSDKNGRTFLASCSQDCLIRIWKLENLPNVKESETSDAIKVKEITFSCYWKCDNTDFIVTLESVCAGHENWVYSVHWQHSKNLCTHTPGKLLSASMDKTLILWEFDEVSKLWLEKVRVGDVGGNVLGFYGGVFSPNDLSVLGHSYQGALHLWHYNKELDAWEPGYAVSGHFREAEDIVWDSQGSYLLSCSADQTVRLHAPHKHVSETEVWHELARPQVHGYDINCLTMINRCKFASGADEKVVRVFEASKNFVTNIKEICKINIVMDVTSCLAEGATVPPLGLSNKAVFEADLKNKMETDQKHPKDRYPDSYFVPIVIHQPPSEDILLQNTLWPEVQKLYGHGYEIYALACNYAGTIVASACKASKVEHAGIILWDSQNWKQIGHLYSHTLTITQIAFSPNDYFLLSVSRDRTWALFEKTSEVPFYQRVAFSNKVTGIHTRIIWGCSWSHDSKYFATGSRDKTVIVWGNRENSDEPQSNLGNWMACTVPFVMQDAVTAIDFAPALTVTERYLVAIGLEKGEIQLHTWQKVTGQLEDWHIFAILDCKTAHYKTVRRLRFSPSVETIDNEQEKQVKLASCSYDHCVKIFTMFV